MLNATGWKVGWAIGPEALIRLGGIINNTTCYCTNHPAQVAVSRCLGFVETADSVSEEERALFSAHATPSFLSLQRMRFQEVRDFMFKEISEMDLPWKPLPCESGYFMMVDVQACRPLVPKMYFETHDYDKFDEGYEAGKTKLITKYNLRLPGSVTE